MVVFYARETIYNTPSKSQLNRERMRERKKKGRVAIYSGNVVTKHTLDGYVTIFIRCN